MATRKKAVRKTRASKAPAKALAKDLAASYNLSDFDTLAASTDGKDIVISNPITGKLFETPTGPITIRVIGPASNQFKIAQDKFTKAMKRALPNISSISDLMQAADTIKTTELSIEFLADIIVGWENVYFHNSGEMLEFSREECVDLLKALDWIRPQIDAYARDSLNFIKS